MMRLLGLSLSRNGHYFGFDQLLHGVSAGSEPAGDVPHAAAGQVLLPAVAPGMML